VDPEQEAILAKEDDAVVLICIIILEIGTAPIFNLCDFAPNLNMVLSFCAKQRMTA
jgi:hypothetical protein